MQIGRTGRQPYPASISEQFGALRKSRTRDRSRIWKSDGLFPFELRRALLQKGADAFGEIFCLARPLLADALQVELLFIGVARALPEQAARDGERRGSIGQLFGQLLRLAHQGIV